MFRKKKKEPKIELCELWSLNHTLARIISRYLKEFIEASSLSGATSGNYYQKDPENCKWQWRILYLPLKMLRLNNTFSIKLLFICNTICTFES